MTCVSCNRNANDNPVAYYCVFKMDRPLHYIFKCWTCLTSTEKLERDGSMKDPRCFKMQKRSRKQRYERMRA